MSDLWILDGHTPRAVGWDEYLTWSSVGFRKTRRVAETEISEVRVSTVFLTIDHQFGQGPPILFETMVFGGPMDEYQWRYSTWEEAESGHRRVVEAVRAGTVLDD